MADNKKIAEQVLAAVGGAANLKDATHCMTRLRLYLKDDSLPKDDEVKKISGVLGVVRGGQQYQIVIGTNVPKVYEELCKLAGISASDAVKDDAAAAQDAAITKRKLTPKQAGKNIMGYLAGCMTPMIPVLLAGGLFRAVNSIFGPDLLGLYTLESNLYILFDFLYDAAFYFMKSTVTSATLCSTTLPRRKSRFWTHSVSKPIPLNGNPSLTASISRMELTFWMSGVLCRKRNSA